MQPRGNRPGRSPRNQVAAGGFLAIWAATGWWSAARTPALWVSEYGADPGPGLLPMLVLGTLSLGALTLVTNGLRGMMRNGEHRDYWSGLRRHTLVPTVFVVSLLVYIAAMRFIGFIPASGVFAFAWMVALGARHNQASLGASLIQATAGTLIGVSLIYFVFVYLIGVPLA